MTEKAFFLVFLFNSERECLEIRESVKFDSFLRVFQRLFPNHKIENLLVHFAKEENGPWTKISAESNVFNSRSSFDYSFVRFSFLPKPQLPSAPKNVFDVLMSNAKSAVEPKTLETIVENRPYDKLYNFVVKVCFFFLHCE